jgi:hypothetical protein
VDWTGLLPLSCPAPFSIYNEANYTCAALSVLGPHLRLVRLLQAEKWSVRRRLGGFVRSLYCAVLWLWVMPQHIADW